MNPRRGMANWCLVPAHRAALCEVDAPRCHATKESGCDGQHVMPAVVPMMTLTIVRLPPLRRLLLLLRSLRP